MTKRSKPLFLLCTVLASLASCSEKDIVNPQEGFHDVVITATIGDAADEVRTRTCVDMDNTVSGVLGILWQETDCIGVYGSAGSTRNAKFRSRSSGSVRKADFSGSVAEGDEPWRAYYPYSEENDGASYDALKGTLPSEQPFSSASGTLTGDYKYGAPISGTDRFNFRHLFTLLRISIDATGTRLAGDKLESIVLTFTDGEGGERPVNGSFTFSAKDGSWGNVSGTSGTVTMPWTDTPALAADQTYYGFVTVMPTVLSGDNIAVTVNTTNHTASFTAVCNVDFEAENVYNIPLKLSGYAANEDFGFEVSARPAMSAFGFEVADNPGSLLDNRLVWNSSDEPQFDAVSSYDATVSGGEVSLTIPYLYDFTLIPTFTVGEGCTVTAGGVTVVSGETEVDFSEPVTFTVTSAAGESRDYVVSVTNTGLPVVVLEQSGSGDFSEVKKGNFLTGYNIYNKFVDFMIRGKDTDWVSDDAMTVYNADGSVNLATTACGARLRGNTSQAYPKKPFAIKTASKVPVLGMPAHKRWVLLANWLDHSMIRNTVAFDVAHAVEDAWRQSGGTIGDGIPWNVHGQNVELVFVESDGTGHHVGNYFLCEQIKIDGNRLDIQDPYEDVTAPTFETCGYLFEVDNNLDEDYQFETSNGVPFMLKDALPDDSIFSAVRTKVQRIEDNIDNGDFAAAYNDLDINSVIDQWLIWELTMNREYGDPRSVYMFMDGDGKLCAGPVWDFDRGTFQNTANASEQGNTDRVKPYDEWICWRTGENDSYIWYKQLIADATFQATVKERWAVIYPYPRE